MSDPFMMGEEPDAGFAFRPIWSIDYTDENELLDYAKNLFAALRSAASTRHELYRDNVCRYRGFYREDVVMSSRSSPGASSKGRFQWPRIIMNDTRDLIEQKISKTAKVRPVPVVVPENNEEMDKQSAIMADKVGKSIELQHNVDRLDVRMLRRAILGGEAYQYIAWDKRLGDIVKSAQKKMKAGEKIWKLDEKNQVIHDEDGNPVEIEEVPHEGDVAVKLLDYERVFLIPGATPEARDVPGVLILNYKHVTELKADFPDKEDQIEAQKDLEYFNGDSIEIDRLQDCVEEVEVWFRASPRLPKGLYFRFCPSCILEEAQDNPIPYSKLLECSEFGNLPIERLTDVDLDNVLFGWSSMHDINVLQNQCDKITTLISRNIFLFCHPKWMIPRGSANLEQLSNGSFACQWSGVAPPQLMTYQSVTQEIFTFWEALQRKMGQLAGIYAQSRGEAPTGARSASQLMIYDEQEEEHRATFRQKFEQFVVARRAKILAIAGANYNDSDGRVARILGYDKAWTSETFEVADLNKPHVIRIQASNALPDNKYARIRTLLEIHGYTKDDPSGPLFTREQLLDAFDFGQHEKFIDYARVAIVASESENERFIKGEEVLQPELYEDLISHWRIHAKLFQNVSFKRLPKDRQAAASDHMLATEYLMFQQAAQNPAFQAQLMQLSLFPLFYVQPAPVPGAALPPQQPASGSQSSESNSSVPPPMIGEPMEEQTGAPQF